MIQIAEKRSVASSSSVGKKITAQKKITKNTKSKHFRWGRLFKWIAIPILSIGLLGFTFAALLFASYASTSPKLDMSKIASNPNTKILDKDGNVIAKLGAEQRVIATTDQIPMTLVNALTSIEDHRFFEHRGVDQVRIIGSLLHNIRNDTTQGGSTLTQELIKLSFFSTSEADRTIKRKAQEAWMSIELEKKVSKEEIITLYINKVFMSNNVYGMQTAAEAFYGKQLSQLSLPQLALLAGMPQAPNDYDPYKHPEAAKKRRDIVLQAMARYGKITKEEETAAINTPIGDGIQPLSQVDSFPLYLNSFITEALLQIKNETGKDPASTSMTIYTTLDKAAQERLRDVFDTGDYVNYPDNQQVAATIVDPKTGAVIAQMGKRDQTANSILGDNPAVNTDRDWGSAMKPITDYAPGLDNGTFKTTGLLFDDSAYNYPGTKNPLFDFDQKYLGNITMRYALWQSRNIPAIKALDKVGLDASAAFLKSLGIQYYPSIVYSNGISSNTHSPIAPAADRRYGASSEKMAAAYAALANGGKYTTPYYVTKITYADGVSKDMTPNTIRVMKEATAFAITDMLKGVIPYGTNGSSFPPNRLTGLIYQAGKTGTSNYTEEELSKVKAYSEFIVPDETFVGYTKEYAIAVWTGFADRNYPVQDILVPGEVYTAMMEYFYPNGSGSTDWKMPEGISRYGSELYMAGSKPSSNTSSSSSSSTDESTSSSSSEGGASVPDLTQDSSDAAGVPTVGSSITKETE